MRSLYPSVHIHKLTHRQRCKECLLRPHVTKRTVGQETPNLQYTKSVVFSLNPDSVFRQKAVIFNPVSRSRCNSLQENSNRFYTLICLYIVWCLSQNITCSSAWLVLALFFFPSDTMGVESWDLWSYCLVVLLGVACYLLSEWFRAVCFVLQLPGPPVVPLLGNALLISNHQSEFR